MQTKQNELGRNRLVHLTGWALIILTVLAILTAGCGERTGPATVVRRDIVVYDTLSGDVTVPPTAMANLLAPYQAPVRRVNATVGQAVRRNEVVVELSNPPSQAYYQQARQRVLQARQQLAQARRAYDTEVAQAQQALNQARVAERQARQYAQSPRPATEGASESPDQEPVVVSPVPDLGALTQQRQAREQALADARVRRDTALAPYQQALASAEQDLQNAQGGLDAAMVRAPITGTVTAINVQSGEVVRPDQDQPIAQIVDLNAVKVYSAVGRKEAAELKPKDPAIVTIEEVPNTQFPGEIEQIYTQRAGLLRGAEYVVVTGFRNKLGQAKPGMKAQVSIPVAMARNVLAVPADAVYEDNDKYYVNVQRQNGEWRPVQVVTGLSNREYTEIKSGLNEGDVVQTNP